MLGGFLSQDHDVEERNHHDDAKQVVGIKELVTNSLVVGKKPHVCSDQSQ